MALIEKLLKVVNLQAKNPGNNGVVPIDTIGEQTQDERNLVAFVVEQINEVRQSGARVALEGQWLTNIAYVMGYDGLFFDTTSRQFRKIGRSKTALSRDRVRVNKILPTLQRRQARLCKNMPRFEVRPDEETEEAKDRARKEQQIIEDYWDRLCLQHKRLQAVMGAQECGLYWLRVFYNTDKGEFLDAEDDTGSIMLEREGDVDVEVCSAFEIFPDPQAKSMDELTKLTHAKVRNLDYFRRKYPERGHLVKEEGSWLLSVTYEQRINAATNQGPTTGNTALQMKNSAIECSYYEAPTKDHPNGRLIIVANGVLLANRDLPVGEIPFVRIDDIPVTGRFYPEALTTHLRPLQDQYNRVIQNRATWTNICAHGKFLAAKGHGLLKEALNDQNGEVIEYNPVPNAPPPTALQVPVIPQYMYQETEQLDKNFYDIAGEGDVSRGVLPSASVPAIGMQLLLEQDETRISVMTEQQEIAFAQLGKFILMYAEEFVTNERLLKRTGPDSQYQIQPWTGDDITSKHDIVVKRGSMAPSSRAQKRNDIMNAYQSGLLGPQQDPDVSAKVLKSLEYGDVSDFWQDIALDMAQIQKKIIQIEEGIVPNVNEGDNHPLTWRQMNKYRKSDKFETLGPKRQAIFLSVMEEHLQEMVKIQAPNAGMSPDPTDDVDLASMQLESMMPDDQSASPMATGPAQQQLQSEIPGLEQKAQTIQQEVK